MNWNFINLPDTPSINRQKHIQKCPYNAKTKHYSTQHVSESIIERLKESHKLNKRKRQHGYWQPQPLLEWNSPIALQNMTTLITVCFENGMM